MSRSKNTASASDIGRLLRAEGCLSESKYLHSDIEKVVENYADFMVAVLKFTQRPIESLLVRAAEEAFDKLEPGEAKTFASRMTAAFSYCRDKSRKMTTGKKLNAAVLKVCTAMLGKEGTPSKEARPSLECKEGSSRTSGSSTDIEAPLHHKRPLPVRSPSPVQNRFSTPDRVSKLRKEMSAAFGTLPDTMEVLKSPIVIEDSPVVTGRNSAAAQKSSSAAGSQHGPSSTKYVQYEDSAKLCVCRILPSGQVLEASMQIGSHGFLIARFADEEPFESEIPNALFALKSAASGIAVMRKPAAATQQVKRKAKDVDSKHVPREPSPEFVSLAGAEDKGDDKADSAASTLHDEEGEEESAGSPDEEIDPDAEEPAASTPDPLSFKGAMLKYVPAKKQSYIQEKIVVAGKNKLRLVVAVSETQSQNHKQLVKDMFDKLCKMKSFTKSKAVGLRTVALSSTS